MVNLVQPRLKVFETCICHEKGCRIPRWKNSSARTHSPCRVEIALLALDSGMALSLWQRLARSGALMVALLMENCLKLFEARRLRQAWVPSWMHDNADLHRPSDVYETGIALLHSVATIIHRQHPAMPGCGDHACTTASDARRRQRYGGWLWLVLDLNELELAGFQKCSAAKNDTRLPLSFDFYHKPFQTFRQPYSFHCLSDRLEGLPDANRHVFIHIGSSGCFPHRLRLALDLKEFELLACHQWSAHKVDTRSSLLIDA